MAELHASVLAQFMDPATGVQRRCPLIQNNGVIQALGDVIRVWAQEPEIMGQSSAFRMFTCPVTKAFATISPFPVIDSLMKLAASAGIDTTSPVVFRYKGLGGAWIEFAFNEQLELIARLCSVYRDREKANLQPEARSFSIPEIGSVVILMKAVAEGGHGFRLNCVGMSIDGSKVEITTVFDPSWVHPFEGMEFPSDA
jgi:hypothetical protein